VNPQPPRPEGDEMNHETQRRPGSARRRRRTRGQALVEFAMVLPIFILLLAGMLDFGSALYSRMTVINAAREGARAAVTAPDKTLIQGVVSTAVSNASNGLSIGASATCVAIKTTPAPCNFGSGAGTLAKPGDAVDVTVTYTYQTFFPFLFGATFDLGTTVRMVLE
jgi:Flp pilus assembly protein TadG